MSTAVSTPASTAGDGQPYGPNSRAVERFLACLAGLSVADIGQAVGRWRAIASAPGGPWYAAEDAIAEAVHAVSRHGAQEQVTEAAYDVFRRRARGFSTRESFARAPGSEATAQYVSTSALLALVVRDAVSPEAFAVAYGPFADAIPLATIDTIDTIDGAE
jgi:hypothetical protein